MIAVTPRPHDLYTRPLRCKPDAQVHLAPTAPTAPTSIDIAIRAQLREKGRMTLAQIIECIGDRTATGKTAHTSRAAEALDGLVEIGAVDVRGRGAAARYSTMFGPDRDYDPEARERAKEAATSQRCAEMLDRERIRANQERLVKKARK